MEIVIGSETIILNDELIENLVEVIKDIYITSKEVVENISNTIQTMLEESHQHCYGEDNVKHYYDKSKGCRCKKVTYRCPCGKKYFDTYECYEPPPKDKNKSKVLEKNKKKYSNHK